MLLENFFCKDRRADEHRIYPMIIGIVINRISGDCQKNLENPQNFLRILKKSEDEDPQKKLMIPQEILKAPPKILRVPQ